MFSEDINFIDSFVEDSLNNEKKIKKDRQYLFSLLKGNIEILFESLLNDDISKTKLKENIENIRNQLSNYEKLSYTFKN